MSVTLTGQNKLTHEITKIKLFKFKCHIFLFVVCARGHERFVHWPVRYTVSS